MAIRPEDLPSDPAALAEMVLAFEGENEDLRAQIATLKGLIFGARSERSAIICAEQLAFDLERTVDVQPPANDDEPEAGAPRTKRRKPRRNIGALPAHLPRCEQMIEPASTLCPCCSGQMHRIGEETSEALDRVPAWLRVLRTIRPKYACRGCEGPIVQAPAPARLVEGGMATTALIAHIATAKYAWQSTLYRQAQILAGQGVVVDRQTLARWMGSAAWMAKGLYDLQLKTMHGFERLFCDETPMPVLDPGRGRTKVCQFWAHATDDRPWKGPAPPAVAYVFAGGRGKKEIMTQLAGFEGVLQVDGYAAYASLAGDAKMSGKIRLAYCLVHARRNFVKVHKTTNSPFAREVIERIGAVYVIEEGIRGLDADERRAVRQAETKPLMEALKARLEALSTRPESFEPLFVRSWDGEVDARPWCMGFYAVMKLRLLAWSQLLSPDRIEHYLLLPILFHCVDDAGRPAMPLATPRCASNAWRDIPATVEALRQFWMPIRFKRGE